MPARLVGEYACWCCKKPAPVKETESGKLMARCDWCDFKQYADAGTVHHATLLGQTKRAEPEQAPEAPPPSEPPRAPTKKAGNANPFAPGA